MWYPDYQNKKLNLCMLKSFKDFHLCIKQAIIWSPDNQHRKKLNLCMLLQANKKNPLGKSNKNTKYVLAI